MRRPLRISGRRSGKAGSRGIQFAGTPDSAYAVKTVSLLCRRRIWQTGHYAKNVFCSDVTIRPVRIAHEHPAAHRPVADRVSHG